MERIELGMGNELGNVEVGMQNELKGSKERKAKSMGIKHGAVFRERRLNSCWKLPDGITH